MRKTGVLFLVVLFCIGLNAKVYDVTDYGAKNDTSFVSTQAFQKAINVCHNSGGGKVVVPAGQYVIGSIFLKSNVEFHVSHGANVLASRNIEDYIPVKPNYTSLRTNGKTIQLIYAENQDNIAITGSGIIDGRGKSFERSYFGDEGIERPHLARFIQCQKVRVRNVTMKNAACWMQHYLACTDVYINGILVINHVNFNNDGIDIDGCKNVLISDVIIDSDDDGIVLKSTSERWSENVVINNAIISSHCNALKLGTESNGGFKNITISNCVVRPSRNDSIKYHGRILGISGISLEMVDGGTLKGVMIDNVRIEGTTVPLFIRLGERNRPFKKGEEITNQGNLFDVNVSNITAVSAGNLGCSITGTPSKNIEGIRIRDSKFSFSGGVSESQVNALSNLEEYGKIYPEATMFGHLPAHGFYLRKVNNVVFEDVEIKLTSNDPRPAFVLEEVTDAILEGVSLQSSKGMQAGILIKDSQDVLIREGRVRGSNQLSYFVKVKGIGTQNVRLSRNDDLGVGQSFLLQGVSEEQVKKID